MNIVGQDVKHRVYGTGKVISQDEMCISVQFSDSMKRFVYSTFFEYLTAMSEEVNALIREDIKKSKEQKSLEYIAEKPKDLKPEKIRIVKNSREKTYPRSNIAFKCNFCDGGKSATHIGFNGVCSDAIIKFNIKTAHRTWCSCDESSCLRYLEKKISRAELDSLCQSDELICYESQMLRDWKAFAGVCETGINKGKPKALKQVQKNSLCILTTCEPGMNEHERYIFAVFIVEAHYEGDNIEAGFVAANSKYRIELQPLEARKMLFWKYYANGKNSEDPAWSSGLHRYISDEQSVQILRDIIQIKRNTCDAELSEIILKYFCNVNKINTVSVDSPKGALVRK